MVKSEIVLFHRTLRNAILSTVTFLILLTLVLLSDDATSQYERYIDIRSTLEALPYSLQCRDTVIYRIDGAHACAHDGQRLVLSYMLYTALLKVVPTTSLFTV